ncbi:MAG: outer membrane protein assembly factor BamD [Candidatus Krumholzibacteriota bacterium]|nr:outer membrane protein assembly factor BamD [Candidatus Krumholzibacteriota bacterium]
MKKKGRYISGAGVAVLLISVILTSSCGGPYTAKKVNQPDSKLLLADELLKKERYAEAAAEYKDFLAVFAGDERSDFAQFMLAECLRLEEDYTMAAIEYRILINDYGYSEYIDDAFYLEGLCSFMQSQRPERDQTKTYEALSRINRFLRLFPNSPRKAEAEKTRGEIHDLLGEKEFMNAKVYFSRKHYKAANIYFEKVVEQYPETVWAAASHYYKGRIAENTGDTGSAVLEYGKSFSSKFKFDEKSDAGKRMRSLAGDKESGE